MEEDLFIVLGVCVVLPVLIIWIIARSRKHEVDRKTEVMLKAIEAGVPIDPEMFKQPSKKAKTPKEDLLERFNGSCITGFMGVALLALGIYFDYSGKGFLAFSPTMLIMGGSIMLAVGIALFISYRVGKKTYAKDFENE